MHVALRTPLDRHLSASGLEPAFAPCAEVPENEVANAIPKGRGRHDGLRRRRTLERLRSSIAVRAGMLDFAPYQAQLPTECVNLTL